MSRDYNKENEWSKNKYMVVQLKLDRSTYEEKISQIKSNQNITDFFRKAIELYESNPELFK